MEIPRFEKQNVNTRFVTTDIGDSFQQFVQELLLPEHPALYRFPGGGKDGGIDLIDTSGPYLVVECKVIGEDDYAEVERRWKTVRNHLDEHLLDPSGPTKGQSQYGPWYSTDTPITKYVFCVSASLANEQQRRDLQKVIAEFFHDLARRRSHLSHLSSLEVSILDWNELSTRLWQRPHSLFRWFPSTRPNGLVPLDEAVDVGTFRAYLTDAKLPYYSLAEHLQMVPAPKGIGILDEESLLTRFENPEITGLVISGKGGIGKSRLTLELGWLALRNGWSVMRVQSRLKEGALEDLAERLTPETSALLLVDYIETQSDFGELIENLNVLNDSGVARLRYIAACRTGYYHQAIAASGRHLPVDLTPPPGDVSLDWFSDYRRYTVGNILAKAGLQVSQQHLTVCRDLPILAVFLAYLHTSGRSEDLAELLTEVEFGRWVAKRVQLTFPSKDVSRDLALLVPLFPIADSAAEQLSRDLYRPVFDRLATDGWVEKVPANASQLFDTWVTAHDVLADQIVLSYLRSIAQTAESFVAELFSLAAQTGCLAAAIVSLQRIADTPPLSAIHWAKVITDAIAANELAWREVRCLLIRTTLLSVPDLIALLQGRDGVWSDVEHDVSFQKSLGWLARWVATSHDGGITEQQKEILTSWISKAVPLAETSNFVITWGLRLAPEIVGETALRWISARPTLFQTHYLMVAWLECGLSTESIALSIQRWCQNFAKSFHLSFVVTAWLNAGGDKALVEDAVKNWLKMHKADDGAQFVYNAWLDAKADIGVVEEGISSWLAEHKTDAEIASHVYKAWLDAGGDKALVQDAIKDWLMIRRTAAEAQYVYGAWLDAGGDKALVHDSIKDWLSVHQADEGAEFVFSAWLHAKGDSSMVRDAINHWLIAHKTDANADFIYKDWLAAGGDKALVRDGIRGWLAQYSEKANADHILRAWLEAGGERDLVWDAALAWLAEHRLEESAVYVTKFIARQRDLPPNTIKHVLAWCRAFPKHEDALWRLTQLRKNLFVAGLEEDIVLTSEAVLADLLPPTSRPGSVTRGQVTTVFSYLVEYSPMHRGSLRERVDTMFVKWLQHPLSFGVEPKAHWSTQRVSFLSRLSALLAAGTLDIGKDRESLKRFVQWIDRWDLERKENASPLLDELKNKYPAPDLWNIVKFLE